MAHVGAEEELPKGLGRKNYAAIERLSSSSEYGYQLFWLSIKSKSPAAQEDAIKRFAGTPNQASMPNVALNEFRVRNEELKRIAITKARIANVAPVDQFPGVAIAYEGLLGEYNFRTSSFPIADNYNQSTMGQVNVARFVCTMTVEKPPEVSNPPGMEQFQISDEPIERGGHYWKYRIEGDSAPPFELPLDQKTAEAFIDSSANGIAGRRVRVFIFGHLQEPTTTGSSPVVGSVLNLRMERYEIRDGRDPNHLLYAKNLDPVQSGSTQVPPQKMPIR